MSVQEHKKNPSAFLRNIFHILQNTSLSHIIEWAPSGNGFLIKNLPEFQASILPLYFKHKKYSSFVRQLNMYGFHKQRNSSFQNCFLHQQFKRGNQLPLDIRRKPEKKKKAGEFETEHSPKENDWFSFSNELKICLPHIAQNILLRPQKINSSPLILTNPKNSNDHQLGSSQSVKIEEEEQYVSKISLRGLVNQEEENFWCSKQQSCADKKIEDEAKIQQKSEKVHMVQQKIHGQENRHLSQGSYKKVASIMVLRNPSDISRPNSNHEFYIKTHSVDGLKSAEYATVLTNFFQSTVDSLSSLSEVLVRQNQILRKVHPVIRKTVLKMQQNKITYLNQEIQMAQRQQSADSNQNRTYEMKAILKGERVDLVGLSELLEEQVEELVEMGVSRQEQNPISTTSIRFGI